MCTRKCRHGKMCEFSSRINFNWKVFGSTDSADGYITLRRQREMNNAIKTRILFSIFFNNKNCFVASEKKIFFEE